MESNQLNFGEFEEEVRAAMSVPDDGKVFINNLRHQVISHHAEQRVSRLPSLSVLILDCDQHGLLLRLFFP